MKNFKPLLLLLFVALSLNACATKRPNGKLAEKHPPTPFSTTLAVHSERKLQVTINKRNTTATGGGLIGVLVVGLAVGIEKGIAMRTGAERVNDINKNFSYDYLNKIEKPRNQIIQNAKWLNVKSVTNTNRLDGRSTNTIYNKLAKESQAETLAIIQNGLAFNEEFTRLTNSLTLQIKTFENGVAGSTIYQLTLSNSYVPPSYEMDRAYPEKNVDIWLKNNGAEIRKGLSKTTKDLHKILGEMLKTPYPAPKETKDDKTEG